MLSSLLVPYLSTGYRFADLLWLSPGASGQ